MKTKQMAAAAIAAVLFLITGAAGVIAAKQNNELMSWRAAEAEDLVYSFLEGEEEIVLPEEDFLGCLDIVGEILPSGSGSYYQQAGQYDHTLYLDFVDMLMDCPENKGLLLYVDSPGGTVYESDELYWKIMEYKEETSRPVFAYFASEACSGGYYIAMAADEIYANRNTWTGSIGVVISLMNYKGLMDTLGIQENDITSGANKTMGSAAEELSEEQRSILQSLVDEAYQQFVEIVAAGRKMPEETVRQLADGRIYSARQALDNGLIDAIAGEEEAMGEILEKAGLDEYAEIYSPGRESVMDLFNGFLFKASALREKSGLEVYQELAHERRNGVLLYEAG